MDFINRHKKELSEIADYLEIHQNDSDLNFDMGDVDRCILGFADKLDKKAIKCEEIYHLDILPIGTFGLLYAAKWKSIDNSVQGAISRIRYFVEHGIPSDYHEQLLGINYMFA